MPRCQVRTLGFATFLAMLPVLGGCEGPTGRQGADAPVLFVSIDTLPADRVACYGCPTVRTPFLDRIARSGLQVADAISPAPLTLPSHTTMLTGVDPPRHGVRENGLFTLREDFVTLAELLPAEIRKFAVVAAFPLSSRFGLSQGFDVYDDKFGRSRDPRRPPERRAHEVFARAESLLAAPDAGDRPFVWTHVFDPHFPYDPPRPWPDVSRAMRGSIPYEAEVAYTDRSLGRYLRRVGASERDRRATILVTADHGEALGSHLEITHSIFVYDATQRVPLMLAGPGVPSRLVTEQRRIVDVAPTVLAAYGLEPADFHEGDPLQDASSVREAYVETKHPELMRGWSPLHGIRTLEWKYIRAPRPELYDLKRDPGETTNVIEDHPEIAENLAALVVASLTDAPASRPATMDAETAARLRSLGYIATIEPGSGHDPRLDPKDGIHGAVALFHGEQAYMDRNLVSAERHLLRALELDAGNKEACSYLAGTYHALGRFELAVQYAERSLSLPPHINEGPVHSTLAEALLEIDRPADALPHIKAALATKRGDARLMRLLSQTERKLR